MKKLLQCCLFFVIVGLPHISIVAIPSQQGLIYQELDQGIASWYGFPHHGRRTASGQIYNMNKLTAAHKTIQLGTTVRVTNLENGLFLDVLVNDRGPFIKGRVIDLSAEAAKKLGIYERGLGKVKIEKLILGEVKIGRTLLTKAWKRR